MSCDLGQAGCIFAAEKRNNIKRRRYDYDTISDYCLSNEPVLYKEERYGWE